MILSEFEQELIKMMVTSFVIVVGWIVAHYFTSQRDKINKRRELTTMHLINTYKILSHEINQRPETDEWKSNVEKVINEVQLFGSKEQIRLVLEIQKKLVEHKTANTDFLVNSLRTQLRKDLGLEKIDGDVHWVRY